MPSRRLAAASVVLAVPDNQPRHLLTFSWLQVVYGPLDDQPADLTQQSLEVRLELEHAFGRNRTTAEVSDPAGDTQGNRPQLNQQV
jgi:hypothetical protein